MSKRYARNLFAVLCALTVLAPSAFANSESTRLTVTLVGGPLCVTAPGSLIFAPVVRDCEVVYPPVVLFPLVVTDARGVGYGWRLYGSATQFAEWDGTQYHYQHKLPLGSLSFSQLQVVPLGTASQPPTVAAGPYILDGRSAPLLARALPDGGMGAYSFINGVLTLTVPRRANNRTYRSELTFSVLTGP